MTGKAGWRARWLRGTLVALLGVAALGVPLYDIWDDLSNLGWGSVTTLIENSVLILLAVALIGAGVWLADREWQRGYLTTVVTWSYGITAAVAVLFTWVVALQHWAMGEPKPYVLVADGVLFAAVIAFGVGVYNAESERAADALRQSEARYRTLTEDVLDSSDVATFILDSEFRIVWVNQATADYFGLDRDAVIGRNKRAVIDESIADIVEEPERFTDLATATYEDNTDTERFECHVLPGEGREERWLEHWSQPIEEGQYAGGRIEHYTDITEQKRSQAALRERERSLRRMYEVISDPDRAFEAKVDGLVSIGRDLFDAEYGSFARIDAEADDYHIEVVQSESLAIESGDTLPFSQTYCQQMVEQEETVQFATAPFDGPFGDDASYGTDQTFETYVGTPVAVDGDLYGALCFLDRDEGEAFDDWAVTLIELMGSWVGYELERKQLLEERERRLRESQARLASVVDSVEEYAIFTIGADETITSWNEGARDIFGYDADTVVGEDASVVAIGEDDRHTLEAAIEEDGISGETWSVRADGSRFWADFTVDTRYDESGNLAGYTVVVRDMTDRRAYQQTIEHERERLEFINRVVRHNILNGLNLVNARAQTLEVEVGDDANAQEHVDIIRNRVDDMSDLIGTMRTFINAILTDADHPLEAVPLRETLTEKVELAAEAHDAEFDVHDLPDPDRRVMADELVGEVFENVLSNAVEHNDTETPHVEVWTTEGTERVPAVTEDAGPVAATEDAKPIPGVDHEGEHHRVLTVHIADDGPGVSDEETRAVLQKGESKLSDPGHGFGLYLVREMMESYGGRVEIRDNDPRGAIFDLTFVVDEDGFGA